MKPGARLLATGALTAIAGAAAGAEPVPQPLEVELGATQEQLTHNRGEWTSVYLEGARTFKPRHTLYGGLRETRRFGLEDTEAYGGLYYPLAETWTGLVEATASPTYDVLPKYSVFGQINKSLAHGLSASLGLKHTEFSATDVRMLVAGAEYYWSDFRAAYTLYSSRPEGAGSGPAHRFQLNAYYGERNSAGIAFTTGRETENVGPPRGLIASDVREWSVAGRHWLAKDWAVSWEWLDHEQGDLYRRRGLRVGLRRRF